MATKATAPAGLGKRAKRFWRDVCRDYDLRLDEVLVLEKVCREIDTIERIETALEGADLIVEGSQRQDVANPLLGEQRMHNATLRQLLNQLRLPDPESAGGANAASDAGRGLVAARWGRGA